MSWQDYVDNSLVGSGHVERACILGLDGGLWATSANFQLADAEISAILSAFGNPQSLYENGVRIGGEKYLLIRNDERSIYLRKGEDGAILVKTGQCVLVAIYDSKKTPAGTATTTVESVADYLVENGY